MSLGLQLIQTLTAQLEGTLVIDNDPGVNIRITFPHSEPTAAAAIPTSSGLALA